MLTQLRVSTVGSLAAIILASACSAPDDSDVVESTDAPLTSSARMARYTRIRDVAAARGLSNGYLLAGIAMDETNLAHCWSEATWACQGPPSPDCGGGPVIAGSADGPCARQQGGLGMFQFDAGRFGDTIGTYGNAVLTIDGQIALAVDYVVAMVRRSTYTTNAHTDALARDWINRFDPGNATLRDQWIKTVIRYYNGCQSSSCYGARYSTYSSGLSQVLADTGGTRFWERRGTWCPGGSAMTVGAIDAAYRALGGCGSSLGVPIKDETGAPDGVGRYSVFERGSIYWTPDTGAHEVLGRIRDAWRDTGWEAGPLGYPISGEHDVPGGRESTFEHGSITWTRATNTTTVHATPDP